MKSDVATDLIRQIIDMIVDNISNKTVDEQNNFSNKVGAEIALFPSQLV